MTENLDIAEIYDFCARMRSIISAELQHLENSAADDHAHQHSICDRLHAALQALERYKSTFSPNDLGEVETYVKKLQYPTRAIELLAEHYHLLSEANTSPEHPGSPNIRDVRSKLR